MRFAQIANHYKAEYHHLIISLDGQTACEKLLEQGVSYEILSLKDLSGGFLSRLKLYRSIIKNNQIDKLITYNWGAIEWTLAHWGLGIEHIHIEDGFGPEEKHQQITRRVWFRRFSLKPCKAVIVPSRTLEKIAAEQWKVPARKLKFIANGVDMEALASPNRERYQDLFPGGNIIKLGTISRIRKEKNIPRLLSTFESICEDFPIELWIAGDGPEFETVKILIDSSPVKEKIHLMGNVDYPADFMCHLDLFVLSSDTEQMPYSVLEAAGAGKAVASVDVGDIKNLVAESNRCYVNGSGENELKNSMTDLLNSPELRSRIGKDNREYCQSNFGLEVMLNQYHELFCEPNSN